MRLNLSPSTRQFFLENKEGDFSHTLSFGPFNSEESRFLDEPLIIGEIWLVVKALGTNKTLGQYGYIAEFFKKSWNIEKDDLVRVFQECFGNFDEKYIFLIPKRIDA